MDESRVVNFQRNVLRSTNDAMYMGIANMLGDAIRQSTRELTPLVESLGEALKLSKLPKSRMAAVNVDIAVKAHQAIVKGWYSRLPAKTPTGGAKHLSGYLGRALADPYNTSATTDRVISFINTELLDREAEHWYRVNYGAVGTRYGEGPQHTRFAIQFNGKAFGSFDDASPPDSRSWIPKQRYYKGTSMFPKSVEVEASPYGARAARFFDLGHAVVARTAPQAYDTLWRTYIEEQAERVRSKYAKNVLNMVGDLRLQRSSWTARVHRS